VAKKAVLARKPTFETMHQVDVPQSRNGKHRKIVTDILTDVELLAPGEAAKVPFKALNDSKENVRAALSRESKKRKLTIATAADAEFLYVWREGR
jgi:predicted Co/Zn/Cd cation transporter (cation efflux family)